MTPRAARLLGPDRLRIEDVPALVPGDGEVLVELSFAGVNPLDAYIVSGRAGDAAAVPRTVGVEATGYLDGRPVLVRGGQLGLTVDGVWATQVVVPASAPVPVSEGVDLAQAAGVGVAGSTAWQCIHDVAQVRPGDRALVLGAGGGVGSLLVPLLAAVGVTVWAQVGNPDKQDMARSRGAEHVVVTDAVGLADAVRALAPTVVFDNLGGGFLPATLEVLAPRGRVVSYGASAGSPVTLDVRPLYRNNQSLLGYGSAGASAADLRPALEAVLAEMAAGRLDVPIDRTYPLAEAAGALARLASRAARGKVVLDLRS